MRRTAFALLLVSSVALAAPSFAAPKPKPITQTMPFRDATPDPSGIAVGSDGHCSGLLPREAPLVVKLPAAGSFEVSISGFTGEWALQLRSDKDVVLAAQDVAPPEFEKLRIKVRKATTIRVLPCNLVGSPDSVVKTVFTFS